MFWRTYIGFMALIILGYLLTQWTVSGDIIRIGMFLLIILLAFFSLIRPGFQNLNRKNRVFQKGYSDLKDRLTRLRERYNALQNENRQFQEINQTLLEAKEKAEIAAVTKAQFLSNMSHELRTPMNAVVGLSNILLESNPRPDQVENLNTLKFSADNLLAIINDILDLSKVEEGKIVFEKVGFNLRHLLLNIQSTLMLKAKDKGLHLEIDVKPNVPLTLIGDPVRLSQILLNLTNNAIKFTEKGSVSIVIRLRNKTETEALLLFEVIDTGIGIPWEKQQLIFDSFTQADANTTRLFGGTGLGLAITKKLVELQGGAISLESEAGKGSRFYFSLAYSVSQSIHLPGKEAIELLQDYNLTSNKRILLVEDYKVNQLVARKFFDRWNMEYDIAENGLEAIKLIQDNDYGLVLMDLQMPKMDGYEATKIIRTMNDGAYAKLPIIALSASAMLEIKQRALDIGMNDFVCKPFKPKELYYTIAKFV